MKAPTLALFTFSILLLCAGASLAQDPKPIFDRAIEQLHNNQIDVAMNNFRRVLELTPDDPAANYNLGICYYTLKQYERSVPALRNAIRSKPDFVDAYVYLGNSLDYLDHYAEAVAAYKKAIEYDPRNAEAYSDLGIAYERRKDYAAAAKAFQIGRAHV